VARQLWDVWSQKSDKYDPDDCDRTWDSFKDSPGGEAITLASIFFHARNLGWTDDVQPMSREVEVLNSTHFVAVEGAKTWVFKED
ncbi:MAG: PriCT-2 domain-containing protein, partial [Burkholderiaceae bacterium]|nr:PriCT-2 domain-containing protein [Burkholderiaceae bacterium]